MAQFPHVPATLLDTLLDPTDPSCARTSPRQLNLPRQRFEIRWNGPHWTEIDILTGEILAEGTVAPGHDRIAPAHEARR